MSTTIEVRKPAAVSKASWTTWLKGGLLLLLVVFAFALPNFMPNRYVFGVVIMTSIWVMLALGLNIVVGYAGQTSMAQGAFYGIGAYTSALLITRSGFSFWYALPVAALFAGLAGVLIGYPSLRTKGAYLAITTLAFGLVVNIIITRWEDLTRGTKGITGVRAPAPLLLPLVGEINFKTLSSQYYIIIVFVLLTVYVVHRMRRYRLGRTFSAIRDDEALAESVGIQPMRYKLLAFVASSVIAGVAGSLYALYMGFVSPEASTLDVSFNAIVQVLVGGSGTVLGPIVGAVFLQFLPEALISVKWMKDYQMLLYGVVVLLTVLFLPTGIAGGFSRLWAWLNKRQRRSA